MKDAKDKFDSKKYLDGGSEAPAAGEEVVSVPLDKIAPNPHQPRKYFDEKALDELSQSIKDEGVHHPILLRPCSKNGTEAQFEIITGERRFRASKLAGKTTIPAIIRKVNDTQMKVMATIENIQREDLNFIETIDSYHDLMTVFNDLDQVINKVRKSHRHVKDYLAIREEIYRNEVISGIFKAQAASINYTVAKRFSEVAGRVLKLEKSNKREFDRIIQNMSKDIAGCIDWIEKKVRKKKEALSSIGTPESMFTENKKKLRLSIKVKKNNVLSKEAHAQIIESIEEFKGKLGSMLNPDPIS